MTGAAFLPRADRGFDAENLMQDENQVPETVAVLHVFSGVHLGARIELSVGSWLLGSDDACDLILMGLAPHHARLKVQADGDVQIWVKPEEGPIVVDGQNVSEETALTCGQAWYLGEICFAWNLPNVEQKAIIPQSATLQAPEEQAAASDASAESEPYEAPAQVSPETASSGPELVTEERSAFQPVVMDKVKPKARLSLGERLRKPLPLLCLAVLLAALSFAVSTGPSRNEYPHIVAEILSKAGFADFAITQRWPGVEVRGAVPTPEDLKRLSLAVEDVSFPVFLEVAVDDDLLQAVSNSLGVRGFTPVVAMQRGQGEPKVRISAFMRDTLVEADAFASLERDVPSPPVKERRIFHEQDVVPSIMAALQREGLEHIRPVCLPGRITMTGNFNADVRLILERVKTSLSQQFGVPLFGENVFVADAPPAEIKSDKQGSKGVRGAGLHLPANLGAVPKQDHASSSHVSGDPLGGIKVTGVYTAPLVFITTSDGQRLFQGSVLPNGNVLERITTSVLTLRSGEKIITYPLRGAHE